MIENLRQFEGALATANDRLAGAHLAYQKKLAFEFARRAVNRTPVDEGTTRARWQFSAGAPASGNPSGVDRAAGTAPAGDDAAGPTLGRIATGIDAVRTPYGVMFLTNNSPNILVLEDGGFPTPPKPSRDPRPGRRGELLTTDTGHSRQAPRGMLAVSIEEINAAFPDTRPTDDGTLLG